MFRKIAFWVVLALFLVAAGGGYYYYSKNLATPQATAEAAVQTATVRRGNLTISASGSGSVIADSQLSFGFEESGVITELLVTVGDEVKAGDVLARLKTNTTAESIASSIADAELNVLKAQQAVDDLVNADVSLKLAQAQVAVITAQTNLSDTQTTREKLNYQRCLDSTIESYEANYQIVLSRYNQELDRYNKVFAPLADNDPNRLNALASLMALKESVTKALANINWCRGTATADEIATADANVALAQASLASAQAELTTLQNYPDPQDVAMAEAELASAKAKLELVKETKSTDELVAPMDGTIIAVNAVKGQSVGASAIITIANLSQPMLEVYLDETDLNQIGVGYEVQVVFDALPNQTFTGHVVSVDPSLVSSMNVTAVRGIVTLDADSFAKPQTLPIGLSASVEVISSQANNVLLVPVEAVREISTGTYGVFVMENGQPTLKIVEVGLEDYTYAEIKSGLNEGDVVTTGVVETGQ